MGVYSSCRIYELLLLAGLRVIPFCKTLLFGFRVITSDKRKGAFVKRQLVVNLGGKYYKNPLECRGAKQTCNNTYGINYGAKRIPQINLGANQTPRQTLRLRSGQAWG